MNHVMTPPRLLVLSLALSLMACGDEGPTEPAPDSQADVSTSDDGQAPEPEGDAVETDDASGPVTDDIAAVTDGEAAIDDVAPESVDDVSTTEDAVTVPEDVQGPGPEDITEAIDPSGSFEIGQDACCLSVSGDRAAWAEGGALWVHTLSTGESEVVAEHTAHQTDPALYGDIPQISRDTAAADSLHAHKAKEDALVGTMKTLVARPAMEVAEELKSALEDNEQLKLDVVSADPQEKGLRAALNLGHTLGHALESQGAGRLRHGEAVAIGLSAVLRIAHPQADELIERLNRWGLPTRVPEWADFEGLVHLMRRDKKSNAQGLRVVLPQASSSCVLVEGFEPERLLA